MRLLSYVSKLRQFLILTATASKAAIHFLDNSRGYGFGIGYGPGIGLGHGIGIGIGIGRGLHLQHQQQQQKMGCVAPLTF